MHRAFRGVGCLVRAGTVTIALQVAAAVHALAVDVGPTPIPVKLAGVALSIPVRATLDLRSDADAVHAVVDATANLADLQAKALDIARALPLPKDDCPREGINAVVGSVDSATITAQPGAAVIKVSGHVTAWACAKVFGGLVKTKAGSDTVMLTIAVRPIVVGPRELGLKLAADPHVTTGSAVTEKAARAVLGNLDAKLASSLTTLLVANTAKPDLPSVAGLDLTVDQADFVESGGALGLHIKARVNATGAALTEIAARNKP